MDSTHDNGLLEKAFAKSTDSMLYKEAFSKLFEDKQSEAPNFFLNQDELDLFKFDSVYNYFDTDRLVGDEEAHNETTKTQSGNVFDEILGEVFNDEEDAELDADELEKCKRDVFFDLVCNDVLDVLQGYLDGTDKAHKSVAKDYIKEVAPGYVEKQNEAPNVNMGKDTIELVKIFKKRQSFIG